METSWPRGPEKDCEVAGPHMPQPRLGMDRALSRDPESVPASALSCSPGSPPDGSKPALSNHLKVIRKPLMDEMPST